VADFSNSESMLMFHWPARCRRSSKMRVAVEVSLALASQ
jgi:hypothetical protein